MPICIGRMNSLEEDLRTKAEKVKIIDPAVNRLLKKQAGTELGKAQPKLGLGKVVAKLHNFGQ